MRQGEDLAGKIFHFKPHRHRFQFVEKKPTTNGQHPQPNTKEPDDQTKTGRRSNRLFALHPVVVLKTVKTDNEKPPEETEGGNGPQERNVRAGGDNHDVVLAGDNTPGRNGASGLKDPLASQTCPPASPSSLKSTPLSSPVRTSPPSSDAAPKSEVHHISIAATAPTFEEVSKEAPRPSLERDDADATITEPVEPVMVCNITSQVHDAINDKNYLPIAAPGREYAEYNQKRIFLAPEQGSNGSSSTSLDAEWEASDFSKDGSETGYTTDATGDSWPDQESKLTKALGPEASFICRTMHDPDDQWHLHNLFEDGPEKDSKFFEDGLEAGYSTDGSNCSWDGTHYSSSDQEPKLKNELAPEASYICSTKDDPDDQLEKDSNFVEDRSEISYSTEPTQFSSSDNEAKLKNDLAPETSFTRSTPPKWMCDERGGDIPWRKTFQKQRAGPCDRPGQRVFDGRRSPRGGSRGGRSGTKGDTGILQMGLAEKAACLSNKPDGSALDVADYSPPEDGFWKSSDQIWDEQISLIDDLMKQYVPMPRKDSFVRLDSRTTVDVDELSAFLRPSGSQYELHPASRDLLWQAVVECERGFKPPHEALLDQIQSTTENQVGKAITEQAVEGVNELKAATSGRLKQHIKWPRDQFLIDRILEEQQERTLKLMLDTQVKAHNMLSETYKRLHCQMALVPIEKERPFHPDKFLGQMIKQNMDSMEAGVGEGPASLNKPIKSTLALKAMAEGKPLPSKREEVRAHGKPVSSTRPRRASSNPEDVRPHIAVPMAAHPLASRHSQSSNDIAAQRERPKATLHNKSYATPRIEGKTWTEARDWRGSSANEPKHTTPKMLEDSEVLKNKNIVHDAPAVSARENPPISAQKLRTMPKTGLKGESNSTALYEPVASIQPAKCSDISSIPLEAEQAPTSQKIQASPIPPVNTHNITMPKTPQKPSVAASYVTGAPSGTVINSSASDTKPPQVLGEKTNSQDFRHGRPTRRPESKRIGRLGEKDENA